MQTARGTALSRKAPALLAVGVALVGLGLDQASKGAILESLVTGEPYNIIGTFLRFTLVFNPGAAFGLGTSLTLGLSLFAIGALLACVILGLPRVLTLPQGFTLGLLMAGIAGNLYDRLMRPPGSLQGHVVDFIQLPHFAIFNVADMCITTAAVLILLFAFQHPKSAKEDEQP
ncbi:MAG: signal peptidase II [Propionibacteriaceae bacterium]|nr:signal peptidase II [Propionibacteriaceae bacterium]